MMQIFSGFSQSGHGNFETRLGGTKSDGCGTHWHVILDHDVRKHRVRFGIHRKGWISVPMPERFFYSFPNRVLYVIPTKP